MPTSKTKGRGKRSRTNQNGSHSDGRAHRGKHDERNEHDHRGRSNGNM